ncbi:MAG TPA: TIGR03032 family protein, partial [Bryobacteraceae bacterium]
MIMPDAKQDAAAATDPQPLRSVHTQTFPQILNQLCASVAVTTYQAGKLVLLRPEPTANGFVLNTHFRTFSKPMGFAWEPGRFALGTSAEIVEFHDLPAVARKLNIPESPLVHDACFLPRLANTTGDIQIHEMAWVKSTDRHAPDVDSSGAPLSELWFANTRFSCLCTRSNIYSFVPRWKPPFITALAPEDRCHLNGIGVREGAVRYATALGATDIAGGWRANKPAGGIVLEVPSGEIIARGLSMPHSPRWHQNRLWILESGNGGVGVIDETSGKYQEVTRLPGFTRGIDFAGPYAFVGLSKVRESAVFSGIAIAERPPEERCCGIWVIDTRNG